MSDYIEREAAKKKHCEICADAFICDRSKTTCDELKAFDLIPAADVRPVVHCKDCGHWNRKHQQTAKWSRDKVAMCAWWSRSYGTIQTATNDFCSYGYIEAEGGEEDAND